MNFCMIGVDYKTAPVSVRESYSFSKEENTAFLEEWHSFFPDAESVLLSTCNRTELYLGTQEEDIPEAEILHHFISFRKGGDGAEEALGHLHILRGNEAVFHLFSVASSLESMVLGEPQILAQIKSAYGLASEEGTAGAVLHFLFQSALKTAKKVSVETDIFRHRISLPAVAVSDFALELFEKLSDKRILVLGAGEMAEETLIYLKDAGGKEIAVANRNREKAEMLAERFHGETVDWNDRFIELSKADLVVAATSASEPIITSGAYSQIASKRGGRPLFMVDLSLPRNLDEKLGDFSNIYLYSIDDLEEVCRKNRKARDREIPKAERLIRSETESFIKETRVRDSGAVITEFRRRWNDVKEEEVKRLFNKCSDLNETQQAEVRYAFDRLVNKFLHAPTCSLRDESLEEKPSGLLEAMRKLFKF